MPTRVLFVCLGNICRSPLAEGIFGRIAAERGLDVEIDSAGTGDWHVGRPCDPRSHKVGTARGCRMDMIGRQFEPADFDRFDYIVAMDRMNLRDLQRMRGAKREKVHLMRSFDRTAESDEVPDPYTGTATDFDDVAAMLEKACAGLADEIKGKGR